MVLLTYVILWAIATPQPLLKIPIEGTTALSLTFDAERGVYELAPLRYPRYEIQANANGTLLLLVRGVIPASAGRRRLRDPAAPIREIAWEAHPEGLSLRVTWRVPPVVEHTRRSIRWLFPPKAERPPAPKPTPPQASQPRGFQPGDRIAIFIFWETGDLRRDDVRVDSDGTIVYRELGRLPAMGLTPSALVQKLTVQLARYLRDFHVAIHTRWASQAHVTLLGELAHPDRAGEYPWKPGLSLSALLQRAGGWSQHGDRRWVFLYRKQPQGFVRNVVDMEARQAESEDLLLRQDDIIYLPPRREGAEIGVFGLVKREGTIPLHPGEGLEAVLQKAGGPSVSPGKSLWISLLRRDGEWLEIPYSRMHAESIALKDGDLVYLRTRAVSPPPENPR